MTEINLRRSGSLLSINSLTPIVLISLLIAFVSAVNILHTASVCVIDLNLIQCVLITDWSGFLSFKLLSKPYSTSPHVIIERNVSVIVTLVVFQ